MLKRKFIQIPLTAVKFTPMFIAALSTVAKTWKQPKGPSTDEVSQTGKDKYHMILLIHGI